MFFAVLIVVATHCAIARADDLSDLRQTTDRPKPVEFASEVAQLRFYSSIANTVFKPKGDGPFPAVVLAHTCGGVSQPHIRQRMVELLDAGFAVLALDSFGPRGVAQCRDQQKVGLTTTLIDAYAALEHLSGLAIVDASRIYLTGYSWGGMVAPMLASPQSAEIVGAQVRYRALVANYGACSYQRGPGARRFQFLLRDTDRPILMLMASEDKELKPADCFPLLEEMRAAGKPVEWHIYPDTYHAWDQDRSQPYSIRTGWGDTVWYRYSGSATRDSTRRMIEFFNAHR
jgi:dienelactone hydrolase